MSDTIDFGIDLGTTNSSVAVCRRGEIRVFQTNDLMTVTPSVVYVSKTGRMLVGKKAYDIWVQDPENTQAEFKRWMGYSDKLRFPGSGREMSAEDLSAEVLKSLRTDAERQTQERITASVITVPAAFGALQCEATGRAAKMAGFELAPLLQEPIAAAIAYGATPSSRNQRWMVFDLGGGTLDIAIVSTRNDRLAVLDHQGNNRLGGKDIDKLIAETFLIAPMQQMFNLPHADREPVAYHRLMRLLVRNAEQAKIQLSTAEQVTIELFEIGEDLDGKPIELTLDLKRADVESAIQPVIEQCIMLAHRALDGARLSGADLDRILLVGGPTQMPVVRAALESQLGAKLDHSLDPMTVVAQGAALYASTLDKPSAGQAQTSPAAVAAAAKAAGAVKIELAFERASGSSNSPVAGIFPPGSAAHEVKIDAGGGFWTSGWLPVVDGTFQVDVVLQESRPATQFSIAARDRTGNPVKITPAEFTIASMLPMSAPPLPHTIAVETSGSDGQVTYDPIFKRHSPLPAEVRKTYRAERTLRPSEIGSSLPIKFWEIEVSEDPQERWWAGCVHVRAERMSRPVIEGTELELLIKIDASRKLSVELFIPTHNKTIADDVYIPDPPAATTQLKEQMDLIFARLERIERFIYNEGRDEFSEDYERLQDAAETIAERIAMEQERGGDPDAMLSPSGPLRKLRLEVARLEEQLQVGKSVIALADDKRWVVNRVRSAVSTYGSETHLKQFQRLEAQYDRYAATGDARGIVWLADQLWELRWGIIKDRMEFWKEEIERLKYFDNYVNKEESAKALAEGNAAATAQDLPKLRKSVQKLWELLKDDKLTTARDQEAQPGLRT